MPLDHGKKSLDQYCSRLTPSTWSINNNVWHWHRRTWRWQLMCRQVQILATSLNCSRVVCTETPSFRHNNLERIEIHSPYKSTWILAIGETNSTWDTWIKACLLYRPGTHLDLDFEDCVPWLSDISGIHHVEDPADWLKPFYYYAAGLHICLTTLHADTPESFAIHWGLRASLGQLG